MIERVKKYMELMEAFQKNKMMSTKIYFINL